MLVFGCNKPVKKFVVHETKQEKVPPKASTDKYSLKLDSFFTTRFKLNRFNGCVLAAKNGKIVYTKAFGYADIKKKIPLKTTDAFQLASVSKPITALGIMVLVDEGKISLDDSVQKHLKNFPYHGITIRDLLSHYSGLSNYMYYCDELWDSKELGSITNDDVLQIMTDNEPAPYLRPRIKYNYSNTNFMLLASVIEKVSGTTYKKFIEENIFRKAGMHNSFVLQQEIDWRKYPKELKVKGYTSRGRLIPLSYLDGAVGDKGVYSTVEDLYKLDQLLYTGLIVSQKSLKKSMVPLHEELYQCDNYGLGWRINNSNPEKRVVYHTGWWKGFKTHYIRVLPNDATLIVLTNKMGGFISIDNLLPLVGYDEEKVYWKEEVAENN